MSITYKGFSFKNWNKNKSFVLTDADLIKQDLLNHIFTKTGERVGMRGYGTIINDILFDQLTEDTVIIVSDQVKAVIDYDPRVTILEPEHYSAIPSYDDGVLYISAKIFFVELNFSDTLSVALEFESQ